MSFGMWAKNRRTQAPTRAEWVEYFARSRGSLTLCTMLAKFFIFSRISRSLMSLTGEVRWQSPMVYIQSGCSGGMWWSFARTKIRRIERIGQRSGWLSSLTRLRVWSTSEFFWRRQVISILEILKGDNMMACVAEIVCSSATKKRKSCAKNAFGSLSML